MKKRRVKKYISLILILFILGFVTFWVNDYYKPAKDAAEGISKYGYVEINKDKFITISPRDTSVSSGLIFYPGGKVAPEAYIPLAVKIASKGYRVVIVTMPLNLAVLKGDKGEEVIEAYPEIKSWVIGGHSLGGVMAASFAKKHTDQIKGLVLLAAYPQDKDDLSDTKLKVLSIYGSEDGCADLNKVRKARDILPKDAEFKAIEGGNHAQFGSYGAQKGDNEAKITVEEQQSLTAQYIVDLLKQVTK